MPYNQKLLLEILLQEDCRTLDENGKVFPPSNSVYKLVANRMVLRGSDIQPRHVYTIVNEDRNGFKSLIAEAYRINLKDISNADSSHNNMSTDSRANNSGTTSVSVYSKSIKLVLSAQCWLQIAPKKRISSGRAYWKLGEGWSDIIAEKICQQHESIDCVFSFKNNLVTPCGNANSYATFIGYCVECKSKITGRLQNAPSKDVDVMFSCIIEDIQPDLHTGKKKRPLRGKRRENVANLLISQHKDAVTFQREEAKRLKKFGGPNLAIVPNAATLRKAKEQQLLKQLGLETDNPPLNLLHESELGKYAGAIHSISLKSFFCIYWLPEQQQIYTARCHKNSEAIFIIDATGGIAKRRQKHDPHVFLYQCMIVTKDGSVPVFQMVSADQRSFIIGHFLRFILTKGVPRPPTVVCDFGRALVNAITEVFGKCTDFNDYLQKCFDCVIKNATSIPASYVRLDVNHFMAMISRWKCLHNIVIAARRFFIRCIGQAYQMHDFKELTYFIESMLSVALSENIGLTAEGLVVPSEVRMQAVSDAIKGVGSGQLLNRIEEPNLNDVSDNAQDVDTDAETDWNKWADKIYANAEAIARNSTSGITINACYNPEFAQRFKKQLIPILPLWTNVMRDHFGRGAATATSACVESEFADLKARTFRDRLPMRIDKFVVSHLEHLDGKIKLASNKNDLHQDKDVERNDEAERKVPDPPMSLSIQATSRSCSNTHQQQTDIKLEDVAIKIPKSFNVSSDNDTLNVSGDNASGSKRFPSPENETKIWNCLENWRGKADSRQKSPETSAPPKKRANTYLAKCPEWEYIKNVKAAKLPLFKNGLLCQPVSIGDMRLNLKRTCAFDSLFYVLINAMASYQLYAKNTVGSENQIIALAHKILTQKQKITAAEYRGRAEILMSTGIFKMSSYSKKIRTLDAECNVAHLAQILLFDTPSFSAKINCECGYKWTRNYALLNINVDIILYQGFGAMQQAIDDVFISCAKRMCKECKNNLKDDVELGPHLLIDMSVITDKNYDNHCGQNKKNHTLDSVANTVEVKDKKYALAGIVHWSASHYTAYTTSGAFWHEYNDLGPTRQSVSAKTKIQPHLILYSIIENLPK